MVYRWRRTGPETGAIVAALTSAPVRHDVPEWLTQNAPAERDALRTIAPSAALAAGSFANRQALARGRVIHRLLQALPSIARGRRVEAAQAHLNRVKEIAEPEKSQIAAQALGVLDDPRFEALFAEGSRAEVPIVGVVDGRTVSGQVDRLAVTPADVLIADYKSDRAVPDRADGIPEHYVTQLALYRAVLRKLYPNHRVRAALVFTAGSALIEIPEPRLDLAMSRLNATRDTTA
jgi:ATP-dependent helicase/nuclease subunit A